MCIPTCPLFGGFTKHKKGEGFQLKTNWTVTLQPLHHTATGAQLTGIWNCLWHMLL